MKNWEVLLAPIITEKSNDQIEKFDEKKFNCRKYTFKVAKNANKVEIKQAVEAIFNVKVQDVNTVNVLPKHRRVGKYEGYRSAYKKAIVTLAGDQKIDAFNI